MSWKPLTAPGELKTTRFCLSMMLPPFAHTVAMMSSVLSLPGEVPRAIP